MESGENDTGRWILVARYLLYASSIQHRVSEINAYTNLKEL
jgi:hypothetical protein